MTIASLIIARLNADDCVTYGLSNADARETSPGVIEFTYPAPTVAGACIGTLTIAADGSIFDDTMDNVHPNVEAFIADLESMMMET